MNNQIHNALCRKAATGLTDVSHIRLRSCLFYLPLVMLGFIWSEVALVAQNGDSRWSNIKHWQGTFNITLSGSGVDSTGNHDLVNNSSQGTFVLDGSAPVPLVTSFGGTGSIQESWQLPCNPGSTGAILVGSGTLNDSSGVFFSILNNRTYNLQINEWMAADETANNCDGSVYEQVSFPNEDPSHSHAVATNIMLPGFGQVLTGTLSNQWSGGFDYPPLTVSFSWNITYPGAQAAGTVLNVARLSQGGAAPWANDQYAKSSNTMRQRGCGVTSLAMALNYAGVQIDPGLLNKLMVANDDFSPENGVEWDEATRDASGGVLQFHPHRTSDPNYLTQVLSQGHPIIVGVKLDSRGPHHFVLVTGQQNGHFLINDPGHANYTTLDQYPAFETRGYVGDPTGNVAGLDISADKGQATTLLVLPQA